MVRPHPLLILPLVNHFMKQCVESFIPPVSSDVTPADDNFGISSRLTAPHVMTKPAFHASRDPDRQAAELASEPALVQVCVMLQELPDERLIRGVCSLRCT